MIVTALRLVVPNTHHVICPRLRGSGVLSGDSSVSCAVGRDHSLGCIQQLPGWAGRFWKASLTGLASGCASSWLLLLAGQLENPLSTAVSGELASQRVNGTSGRLARPRPGVTRHHFCHITGSETVPGPAQTRGREEETPASIAEWQGHRTEEPVRWRPTVTVSGSKSTFRLPAGPGDPTSCLTEQPFSARERDAWRAPAPGRVPPRGWSPISSESFIPWVPSQVPK